MRIARLRPAQQWIESAALQPARPEVVGRGKIAEAAERCRFANDLGQLRDWRAGF